MKHAPHTLPHRRTWLATAFAVLLPALTYGYVLSVGRWTNSPPTYSYYINVNGTADNADDATSEFVQIEAAGNDWTAVTASAIVCTRLFPDTPLAFAGSLFGGTSDGVNILFFDETDQAAISPASGMAMTRWNALTNDYTEGDIVMNGLDNWANDSTLKAVAMHEMGHCISLGHTAVATAIMTPVMSATALQPDDIDGIVAAYPIVPPRRTGELAGHHAFLQHRAAPDQAEGRHEIDVGGGRPGGQPLQPPEIEQEGHNRAAEHEIGQPGDRGRRAGERQPGVEIPALQVRPRLPEHEGQDREGSEGRGQGRHGKGRPLGGQGLAQEGEERPGHGRGEGRRQPQDGPGSP
ncbi:MAG: hypothetical protein FD129_3291, partial [bacterium]